jgi:O-antigen/teichoic acid export membrane protein
MKSFSFVFAATIIARLSSLISFPITARILPVADMGELTIWHSVRGIILLAVLAGMPDIVAREAGAHKSRRAFGAALKISYLMLAVIAIGMEVVLQLWPDALGIPYPRLLVLAAAIDVVPGLFLSSLAAMGQIRAYVVCIVVPAVVVD